MDRGYPADPESPPPEAPSPGRRGFLGALAAGAVTLGSGLLASQEAQARKPLPLPGSPPVPRPPRRPPPHKPNRDSPSCDTSVTLAPRFHFCGGTYGQVVVESSDARLLATLKLSTETKHLRRLVGLALKRGGSCTWLQDPRRVTQMERAIGTALHTYYQRQLCRALAGLKVQLIFIPPAAPRTHRPRLPGGIGRPRYRACASCNTGGEPQDLLAPLGLTVLGLYAIRRRRVAAGSDDDSGHDA